MANGDLGMRVKLKANIPEIVLGVFLTVAVFAMGITFQSSRTPVASEKAHQSTDQRSGPPTPEYSADKTTDWLLVGLNLFLVISTLLLWKANNRSAKIAALALSELEIPFVALKVTDPGIRIEITINGEPVPFHGPKMDFCFANHGRTPATLTQLKTALVAAKIGKFPDIVDPNKVGKNYPFGVMVGPNDTSQPSTRFFRDFISEGEKHAFENGELELFLIGFVKFTDIFRSKYTLGFCAKFDRKGGRFVLEGESGYNYQTKRK
jgi:hypothetical protein